MRILGVSWVAVMVLLSGCSNDETSTPPDGFTPLAASEAVTAGMEAELSLTNGATLKIPFGAVPIGDGGGFPIEFTLETTDGSATPPAGETVASELYTLGPGYFTFAREVELTIPVTGTPQAEQVQVYRIDPATSALESYNAVYDPSTKSASVQTRMFSPWFATIGPAADSTASGAFAITNTSTDTWINVCATSFQPKFAGQGAGNVFEPVAAAPAGSIGWNSTINWYVPQGTYTLCVEAQKAGTATSAPGAPSYVTLTDQVVDQPWKYNDPQTTALSFGALTGSTAGACSCTPTPTVANRIFYIGNIYGVYNQPTAPTEFTTSRCYFVADLATYHWNDSVGKTPGTISLKSLDGTKTYGPWQASGTPGQGGVVNAYWNTYPAIKLPAGTYTVIDSDPASWSQNSGTGGMGMAWADGVPAVCP